MRGWIAVIISLIATAAIAGFSDFQCGSFNIIGGGQCLEQCPSLSPGSYTFANESTTHTTRNVFTLNNSGRGYANISSLSMDVRGFRAYSTLDSTCLTNLAPGSSCTVLTKFSPYTSGSQSGRMSIVSRDYATQYVNFYGTGLKAGSGGGGGNATVTMYANADTTGTSLQKGTGTITVGASVTASAAQVSNGWDLGKAATSAGRMVIPTASNISATIGTMGFYIKNSATAAYGEWIYWTSTGLNFLSPVNATNYLFKYKGASTATVSLPTGEWHFVELAWKSSTNNAAIRLDGGTWAEISNASGAEPTGANLTVGDITATTRQFSIDQLIISSGYKDDLYALRANTSF